MLQPSHRKGRREATLAQAPTGEATRPSSPQKQKHPKCSMVVSTSQEQTLTSDHLQDWSTNVAKWMLETDGTWGGLMNVVLFLFRGK
ncbi:hypothetical protein AB205_0050010, partial [Aquarana catesbeiana]